MKVKCNKVIKYKTHYELTREDLLHFVKMAIPELIDAKVRIFVKVPTGGDYSGAELDLDTDTKLEMVVEKETPDPPL